MNNPNSRQPVALPGERVNNIVAEVFQAATIALIGVLGLLTVAASI